MTKAAEWVERIKEWKESGLRAEEFAKGKDFRAKTLVWWSSELKRRAKRVGATKSKGREVTQPVKVARVVVAPREVGSGSHLELRIGKVALSVQRGFDRELLAQVVSALGDVR